MLIVTKEKKQVWINYREDAGKNPSNIEGIGEIVCKFLIQPVSPSEMDKIMKNRKEVEWDSPGKRQAKQRFLDYDFIGITYDRIDHVIIDWEDVAISIDGKPPTIIECTRENKLLLFERLPDVVNHVLERAQEIGELEEGHAEEVEKNSVTS